MDWFSFSDQQFQALCAVTKAKAKSLIGLNSVCLFSGGLDSAVGAIDILNGESNLKPLLVSHAYRGDGAKQKDIKHLLSPPFGELSYSMSPHIIKHLEGKTEISMRGRSFNFLAMAVLGISACLLYTSPSPRDQA